MRRLLVCAGLLGLLSVGDGFLFLRIQESAQLPIVVFPLLAVGSNLAYMLLAVPVGRLADRWGRARILVVGHVLLVLAYAAAALPGGGIPAAVCCLLLLGAFYAATDGVASALAARAAAAGHIATGIACVQTAVGLSRMAASIGFGLLWAAAGPGAAFTVVGLALAAAAGTAWFLIRPVAVADERPENEPAQR